MAHTDGCAAVYGGSHLVCKFPPCRNARHVLGWILTSRLNQRGWQITLMKGRCGEAPRKDMVGAWGLEPQTSAVSRQRSTN